MLLLLYWQQPSQHDHWYFVHLYAIHLKAPKQLNTSILVVHLGTNYAAVVDHLNVINPGWCLHHGNHIPSNTVLTLECGR